MKKIIGLIIIFSVILLAVITTCSNLEELLQENEDGDSVINLNPDSQNKPDFAAGRIILQLIPVDVSLLSVSNAESFINSIVPEYTLKSIKKSSAVDVTVNIRKNNAILDTHKSQIEEISRLFFLEYKDVTKEQTLKIIKRLNKDPQVEYAEPDHEVNAIFIPNDPYYSQQWGIPKTDCPEAWDISQGSTNVIVAVIDTGVDYNHSDLSSNMIPGYDFRNEDPDPMDDHFHGTHVAGIACAKGNNGIGISGVAWNVKIMPLKFLSASGSGWSSDAIDCIDYAILNGAHILNNSWGGGSYNTSLRNAIIRAKNAGILFIAAAGNSGTNNDITPHYPSSYDVDNIIAVASTTSSDSLPIYSCYGPNSVDIAAPGSGIYSTVLNNSYASYSGTSMAAPFVSGACALVKSVFPSWSYTQIKDRILNSSDKLPSLDGKVLSEGRLNVYNAIQDSISDDLYVKNVTISTTKIYIANNNIIAGPNVLITNTGNVTFTAGNKVIINPGVKIDSGAHFIAEIN